jgi:dienelactone hydrolase
MRTAGLFVLLVQTATPEIHRNPGGKELPHDRFIRTVSEAESPVQQTYIRTKDGIYVAAAIRKPKGDGPFPAMIHFHGAPGGRGMEQITGWALGATGSPVWERFLKEGYVLVVADYRRNAGPVASMPDQGVTYVDDGESILEHVRSLPYVDRNRIGVYGVSLGGNLVAHLIARQKVQAAIFGAPATFSFLGVEIPPAAPGANPADRFKNLKIDEAVALKNIAPIQTPALILVGTADSLIAIDTPLHDLMEKAGKQVRMEIYENGYHDFCIGPQGQNRREPLMDATLDALEKSVEFFRIHVKGQSK